LFRRDAEDLRYDVPLLNDGDKVTFTIPQANHIGFAFDSDDRNFQGHTFWYTESDFNDRSRDKIVAFDIIENGCVAGYVLAFEDSKDNDYNDMVIMMRALSCAGAP